MIEEILHHLLLVLFNWSQKAILLGYVLGNANRGALPSVQTDVEERSS